MFNYTELADRMQRELAARHAQAPDLFNYPGKSLACKIDPHYYLAPYPGFHRQLARWCGVRPSLAQEALVRTGNLVLGASNGDDRAASLRLKLVWEDLAAGGIQRARMDVCLIHSSFVDRGVALYTQGAAPQVSGLKIESNEKESVQAFLQGKTELQSMAWW